MQSLKNIFLDDSRIAFNKKHRKTINFNIGRYDDAVKVGKQRYANFELARKRASWIKSQVVANPVKYLIQFEENALKNNIDVVWARDGQEAVETILKVIKEAGGQTVVKSKSMISEEIELNENLEKNTIESIETDLGEFIVQAAGEKPYHILTPAMHKSKEDVAALFSTKFSTPQDATPQQITGFVRQLLRKNFSSAEVGITGANFLVADIGGVALTENEGNGMMSVAFPKLHIVIAGIEKIIPSVNDLSLFFPLLSTMGTGQQITVYNSLISGPKKPGEKDGPEKMVVVLLDNNRTKLANEKEHFKALKCIRCGACLNVCPIYKNVGGHTYNTIYSGPIGSVITPYLKDFDQFNHLSYACTVCGACTEACPVKIPLHDLLLLNRRKSVEQRLEPIFWNMGMKGYEWAFKKRNNLDMVGGKTKNILLKLSSQILGPDKKVPRVAAKSFSKNRKQKS